MIIRYKLKPDKYHVTEPRAFISLTNTKSRQIPAFQLTLTKHYQTNLLPT